VTLNDRDRRILIILVPIVLLLAYWFLLLSPKRADLSKARDAQHAAEQARDAAVAQAAQLEHARQTFAADYAAVVRLGKAIPSTVDSPSLLVQLDRATKGTHIDFNSVTFGARSAATITPVTTTTTSGPLQPNGNAAAGGAPASTGLGSATESAGNAVVAGNQASTAAGGATSTPTGTTTTPGQTGSATTTPAALDQVSLTFNFTGTYFDLADFFHRLKRFVYVANKQIFVRGRLMTIDTLAFSPGAAATGTTSTTGTTATKMTAAVGATVYLSSATQGVTGGATPLGPAGSTTTTTPAPSGTGTSSVPLATAGVR
jgi:hypothetical protein